MDALVRKVQINAGCNESPVYGIIDSQSVKTIAASEKRGIDGGKKIKGRKRHTVVDVLGCILSVLVHAANIHDTKAGWLPAAKAFDKYPTIEVFCGNECYCGSFMEYVGWDFDDVRGRISKRIKPSFEIIPKR